VSQLLQMSMSNSFVAYLTLWSNVTGSNSASPINYGSAGAFPDHVYGVALAQPWAVSATLAAGGVILNPMLATGAATTYTPLKPLGSLTNPGVILISPAASTLQAYDARQ
jgi:hypothetical protein